jgi:uncharacterized repeat protein (TIGR02543 family)
MRKIWNKIVIAVISCTLIFTGVLLEDGTVYATQNRTGNFSTSYSLTGNGADDIVSVARAQVGKTGSQLGYSEEWCADFVGDCAALANQGNAIPRNGVCTDLQTAILNAGGQTVSISSARKGDLAFYGTNGSRHVEIIYANNNGIISSIGGNSGSGSTCYTRSVRNHTSQTMTITKVLRPNYGSKTKILPGTAASGWNVPTTVTASKRITTYDEYGNAESNHYIDPGDSCYISEVYTNGFVKVQYPVSGGKRWAYAKASDFSISQSSASQLPDTQLHAWFSLSPMGDEATSIRYNDLVYLCYRVETKDGNLLNSSDANYSVKETLSFPDGSTFPYNYDKSNNNWIRSNFNQWGTYKGIVEISGDYTGKVEVSYTIEEPQKSLMSCWFSSTKMGSAEDYLEKGKAYYFCYTISFDDGYLNQYMNINYTVTEVVYGPDGKKVYGTTYEKSDRNWIRFTATQTGTYKGVINVNGDFTAGNSNTSVCKDTTVSLQSIKITQNPTKMTYTVGDAIDLSGMVVKAGYSDGSTKNVTGYKISGNTSKAGNVTITVSYTEGGVTCKDSFKVTVKEAAIETAVVTYDPNGGTMEKRTQSGSKGKYITLLQTQPTKNVYVSFDENGGDQTISPWLYPQKFIGWIYSTKSGNELYASGSKFLLVDNCTLTASYDDAKIERLPDIQRDGYLFNGWYTSSGEKVYLGMTLKGNTRLIAHWTAQTEEDDGIANSEESEITDDMEDDSQPLEVGDEIVTDEVIYTITKLGKTPCVEYTELFDEDVTDVVIPDTIAVDGTVYQVRSVAAKALYKNVSVESVTVGNYVTKIGNKAFYGCDSLKSITILSKKIKSGGMGKAAFTKVKKNVKVYVPEAKYKAYRKMLKKAGIGSKAKIYKLSF